MQVWLRIYDLTLEYRKPQMLFNIASGAGFPLKIDLRTVALEQGIYARVLVEVDIAKPLLERILIKKGLVDFLVRAEYEKFTLLPCILRNSMA